MLKQNLKGWVNNTQSFFSQLNLKSGLVLVVLGALNTLAYAPFDIWFIPFFTLALLLLAIQTQTTAKQAAKCGFLYGLGWFGAGISWIHIAIAEFGGIPLVVSLILMLLLCAYLAIYPALASFLTLKYQQLFGLWGFVGFWLIAEVLRSWILTGFPWLALGYTQTSSPLSSFAPVIGEIGLQFVVLLIATIVCLTLLTPTNCKKYLATLAGIFFIGWSLSFVDYSEQTTKEINVALVQGNIEQSIKWQPDNELPTMKKYASLTLPVWENSDLVIWPEAAIPRLEVVALEFLHEIDRQAADTNTALITGIVDFNQDTRQAYNNLITLGKKYSSDQTGHYRYLHNNRYSKHHLLPIGEFVPFESLLRPMADLFNLPMSSFSYGTLRQDPLIANGISVLSAICFEIAFPEQVRANLYRDTDIILTVSNDAWFGDSHGPWQHLQIAQMRAIEFAKPVLRATNNGVTAIIDHRGRLTATLLQNVEGVLQHKVNLSNSSTPYSQIGNLSTYLLVAALLLFVWLRNRAKNSKN